MVFVMQGLYSSPVAPMSIHKRRSDDIRINCIQDANRFYAVSTHIERDPFNFLLMSLETVVD